MPNCAERSSFSKAGMESDFMETCKRGRFIVFEGIDGAGKTTQIDLLEKYLRAEGRAVFRTAEPTESVSGGLLRDALAGVSKRSACEMAALFTLVLPNITKNPLQIRGFGLK